MKEIISKKRKRGPFLKRKVKIEWSSNFSYAIGLLTSDGCLYRDGRHIAFVSKDMEQILNFLQCLNISLKIDVLYPSHKGTSAFRVQIGDVAFYDFLVSIGIYPAKSLTLGKIDIPQDFFFDFIRGHFDGDGCTYSYWDNRWKSSFMFYTSFASGSLKFLTWLQNKIASSLFIKGHVVSSKERSFQLRYAKQESLILLRRRYYPGVEYYLSRKRLKIQGALGIIGESL